MVFPMHILIFWISRAEHLLTDTCSDQPNLFSFARKYDGLARFDMLSRPTDLRYHESWIIIYQGCYNVKYRRRLQRSHLLRRRLLIIKGHEAIAVPTIGLSRRRILGGFSLGYASIYDCNDRESNSEERKNLQHIYAFIQLFQKKKKKLERLTCPKLKAWLSWMTKFLRIVCSTVTTM